MGRGDGSEAFALADGMGRGFDPAIGNPQHLSDLEQVVVSQVIGFRDLRDGYAEAGCDLGQDIAFAHPVLDERIAVGRDVQALAHHDQIGVAQVVGPGQMGGIDAILGGD